MTKNNPSCERCYEGDCSTCKPDHLEKEMRKSHATVLNVVAACGANGCDYKTLVHKTLCLKRNTRGWVLADLLDAGLICSESTLPSCFPNDRVYWIHAFYEKRTR